MNNYDRQKSIVEQNLGNIYKSEDNDFETQGRERIEKAEQAETSTPHLHRQLIKSQIANSFKADSPQVTTEELEKSADDFLEKGGKRAVIGEKRQFGGREYIKTSAGWKFHGKGGGAKATAHREGALDHHIEAGREVSDSDALEEYKKHLKNYHEAQKAYPTNRANIEAAKKAMNTAKDNYDKHINQSIMKRMKDVSTTKQMSFTQVLADPQGKELIETIEHGGSDASIIKDAKDQLKAKFGYDYKGDDAITAAREKYAPKETKPTSKHIGDMSLKEKKAAADKLGISTEGKTVKQINKELADANVDKQIAEHTAKGESIGKTKSGKAIHSDPLHESHSDFTYQDHIDASNIHHELAGKLHRDVSDEDYKKFSDNKDKQHAHEKQAKAKFKKDNPTYHMGKFDKEHLGYTTTSKSDGPGGK